MLFFANKVVSEGLTFNNVLLMASYSTVLPCDYELYSWFNSYIRMNVPVALSVAKAHDGSSIFNIPM